MRKPDILAEYRSVAGIDWRGRGNLPRDHPMAITKTEVRVCVLPRNSRNEAPGGGG